jgi:hypothetical protein
MIAVKQQDQIEIYVSVDGNICLKQESEEEGEYDVVAVAPENLDALIEAMQHTAHMLAVDETEAE